MLKPPPPLHSRGTTALDPLWCRPWSRLILSPPALPSRSRGASQWHENRKSQRSVARRFKDQWQKATHFPLNGSLIGSMSGAILQPPGLLRRSELARPSVGPHSFRRMLQHVKSMASSVQPRSEERKYSQFDDVGALQETFGKSCRPAMGGAAQRCARPPPRISAVT